MPSLLERAAAVRENLASVPDRLRVIAKVGVTSGLMWEMNTRGVLAMVRALGAGAPNPSMVNRVFAANSPDKIALKWRNETITFAELDARIDAFAAGLTRRGYRRGSSIVMMMKNRIEYPQITAALTRMGGAAV